MDKKTKPPQVVYANMVNLAGLYSNKPMRCKYNEQLDSWWDRFGSLEVRQLGHYSKSEMIQFSSVSREEVLLWTEGARSVMKLLSRWAGVG
jgi:hypothetical protein